MPQNSRELLGYPSCGMVRQVGVEASNGEYIAFLDDDDIWLPWKLAYQMNKIGTSQLGACCTEGLIGHGIFDSTHRYPLYNAEFYREELRQRFSKSDVFAQASCLPAVWTDEVFAIHNAAIVSSVVVSREVLDRAGGMRSLPISEEDYDCWKRICKDTNFAYISTPCVYYDRGHAGTQHY